MEIYFHLTNAIRTSLQQRRHHPQKAAENHSYNYAMFGCRALRPVMSAAAVTDVFYERPQVSR